MDNKIKRFGERPSDDDLCSPLGWEEMGTSNHRIVDEPGRFELAPQPIPMKFATIWMFGFCLVILVLGVALKDTTVMAMAIGATLVIVPFMLLVLSWINQRVGTTPYVIVHTKSGEIEFPRLKKNWPVGQVEEVIFVNFGGRHFQVSVLIGESSDQWCLVHAFNDGGTGGNEFKKLAGRLGVASRGFNLSSKDARQKLKAIGAI